MVGGRGEEFLGLCLASDALAFLLVAALLAFSGLLGDDAVVDGVLFAQLRVGSPHLGGLSLVGAGG